MRLISVTLILLFLFFEGCTSLENRSVSTHFPFKKSVSVSVINFDEIMDKAVKETALQVATAKEQNILVTDFVEVSTLKNNKKRELGFILSNKLKNALVKTGKFNVVETEVSSFFVIGKNGLKLLSRDKKNLLVDKLKIHFALVGSYAITTERLILFIKLIDVTNGTIVKSYSTDVAKTDETMCRKTIWDRFD